MNVQRDLQPYFDIIARKQVSFEARGFTKWRGLERARAA